MSPLALKVGKLAVWLRPRAGLPYSFEVAHRHLHRTCAAQLQSPLQMKVAEVDLRIFLQKAVVDDAAAGWVHVGLQYLVQCCYLARCQLGERLAAEPSFETMVRVGLLDDQLSRPWSSKEMDSDGVPV